MQNLTQLQHFRLVAQEQSFARAAELANVTQPALSNSIRSLEKRLGLTLFHRSERPVSLTSAARNILSQVDALLYEASNLDQLLENLEAGEGGHVRLGMSTVYSTSLGGQVIAEWHAKHPKVSLDLVVWETNDLIQGLRNEVIDLFVGDARNLQRDVDDLDLIPLPSLPGGAFCRAGHPLMEIDDPTPQDLARYTFAGTHFPQVVLGEFARFLGKEGFEQGPLVAINSHNVAALRDAVTRSDLILLTTTTCVRNELALGLLQQVPLDLGIDGIYFVATLRGRVHHPAVPNLVNQIIEVGRQENE